MHSEFEVIYEKLIERISHQRLNFTVLLKKILPRSRIRDATYIPPHGFIRRHLLEPCSEDHRARHGTRSDGTRSDDLYRATSTGTV